VFLASGETKQLNSRTVGIVLDGILSLSEYHLPKKYAHWSFFFLFNFFQESSGGPLSLKKGFVINGSPIRWAVVKIFLSPGICLCFPGPLLPSETLAFL